MSKKTFIVSFLLLSAAPSAHAQSMTSDFSAQFDSDYSAADVAASSDTGTAASNDTSGGTSVSVVDAKGNMTINANEDYTTAIDLKTGNLTVGAGATAKSIRVRSGNVTLGSDNEVGSVTVDSGNLTVSDNVTISGNVTVGGKLSVSHNTDITGSVSVGSSEPIIIGDNSDIQGTLTSAAGLKVGSNTDIKLFLSGKSVEIDGKVYKLGGTILASGANTSVGLPFVPKPKSGSAVATTTAAAVTSASQGVSAQATDSEQASGDEQVEITTEADLPVLPDIADIVSDSDVSAYISDVLSSDSNVANVDTSPEEVSLDYKTPASLFGFIPVTVPAHIKVSKDKTVDVSYPWYSFLMSTNKQAVQDAVSQTVSSSAGLSDTSAGLSAKLQATITNSILSAFKNLF